MGKFRNVDLARFLSVVVASIRPANITELIRNLEEHSDNPSEYEVLIKLRDDDAATREAVEALKEEMECRIVYVATRERDGYYSLNEGYDELTEQSDPDSYFFWLLNDEVRVTTAGWDTILKSYVSLFPDDIFRLRLSAFQLKNYYSVFECFPCPDNYALTTRKWLALTGGWGPFWGGDSWHQAIEYYLGKTRAGPYGAGHYRGVPVLGITLENEAAGLGIERDARENRRRRIAIGWQECYQRSTRRELKRRAHILACHIAAYEKGVETYHVEDNPADGCMIVINAAGQVIEEFSYRPSLFRRKLRLLAARNPILVYYYEICRRRLRPIVPVAGAIESAIAKINYWIRLKNPDKFVKYPPNEIKYPGDDADNGGDMAT